MNVAILGGFGKRLLAPGWTREIALAVLGGGEFDLTAAPPGEGARLVAIAFFGAINVRVAPGTRVTMSGFSFLGGRDVRGTPGDGPELHVIGFAILGGVAVKEEEPAS